MAKHYNEKQRQMNLNSNFSHLFVSEKGMADKKAKDLKDRLRQITREIISLESERKEKHYALGRLLDEMARLKEKNAKKNKN